MKTSLIILTLFALLGCKGPTLPDPPEVPESPEVPEVPAHTLDENIGMMLLVGFYGQEVDSSKNPEIISALHDYHVGSVILFDYDGPSKTRGRNIKSAEQVTRLCTQLRAYNPQLLVSIDQEGGSVSRLSSRYGFPSIMSAQKSAAQGLDTVRKCAHLTAEILKSCGINLNFAPVADVNINPSCPVIGGMGRSFSSNPDMVAQCCKIWIEEQQSVGVVSCMKHFPGHGSSKGDTHKGLVDVTDTWQRCELEPYRELNNPYLMVMTAHVINRQLDPSGLPASLSPAITSYLRDTLGFTGVIVTDDLAMGAIDKEYSFKKAIRMAVLAGADLLCLSNNGGKYDVNIVPRTVKIIKKMVADGDISEERIRQSADRVRALATSSQVK